MNHDYVIRQGEPLTLALDLIEGNVADVLSITAAIKKAGPNGVIPPSSAPVLATFDISPRVAAGEIPAGWDLYLDDSETINLPVGTYVVNASVELVGGTGPLKTEPVVIMLKGTVA